MPTHAWMLIGILLTAIIGLVVKITYDWLKNGRKKNGNGHIIERRVNTIEMADKVNSLYKMHNAYDEDGAPKWYFPRSIEKKIDKLIEKQSEANMYLKQMANGVKK